MKIIKPGTQVTYSRKFIRSIQGHELAHRRGTLVSTECWHCQPGDSGTGTLA